MEQDVEPFVPQHAAIGICGRDTQRGAAHSRRERPLALLQRRHAQETEGRQQGTAHHPRGQPHRPLRQHGEDSIRQDCRVLRQVPQVTPGRNRRQPPPNAPGPPHAMRHAREEPGAAMQCRQPPAGRAARRVSSK